MVGGSVVFVAMELRWMEPEVEHGLTVASPSISLGGSLDLVVLVVPSMIWSHCSDGCRESKDFDQICWSMMRESQAMDVPKYSQSRDFATMATAVLPVLILATRWPLLKLMS
jgi:hypothetical protein